MTVRAKFRVRSIVEYEGGNKEAQLDAIPSGSAGNAEFYKWTPSASIKLGTLDPEAAAQFVLGREFYVDFRAVDDGNAA